MKKIKLTSIILRAQDYLIHSPFDLAHDVTHHYRVFQESINIIQHEKITNNICKEDVVICSWLHDIEDRKGKNVEVINTLLHGFKLSTKRIERIIKIIREHSFEQKQTMIESKILFDADKLEYVNPFRLTMFIQATKDGYITKKRFQQYVLEWKQRIDYVNKQMHFDYSKNKFNEWLENAIFLINNRERELS